MTKPQLVLIPGAWHTPECFSLITPKLQAAGYAVHTRQLPSVGSANPPPDLSQDIAAVRELVTAAIGDGNDVLVVPHSWSGIVAGSALTGMGKKQREERGEKGGVVRVAYMCSFIAPEGVSLMDALQGEIPHWWEVQGDYSITKPHAAGVFYNDLPEADQQYWYAKTSTHSFGTKTAKATAASWKEIPTGYLLCEEDIPIPPFAQELMTGQVREMGGEIEITRIKSGHSPFLSRVDETVAWIRRAAGEDV
ncbi:alpha/beta-hydrolase [Trematosphaeria pertusa]|uniref:Alpha/beta-hydrolase n=1 Tax=Trematosphaeria pertusa TaxID=390896 RepID=A0A6A6IK11_9PLEO|nr:alpha/beta-hydrolase [Trematosphaeria pertusa]KAF2250569.1 alpha/beta-hydrolase [Trematosphaeria pertusa]